MTWVAPESKRRQTPNLWRAGNPRVKPIEGIVYHYTAGAWPGCVEWLCTPRSERNPTAGASAHFVVSKAGVIVQLASLDDRTFHAGGTKEKPSRFLGRTLVNGRTWGIEMENLGDLTGAWDLYTEPQISAVVALTRQLVALMPNAQDVFAEPEKYLVGHSDVDPGRKRDPGKLWPWPRIHDGVRGGVCRVEAK